MSRIKKHLRFAQGALIGALAIVVLTGPFSASFGTTLTLRISIAEAAPTCSAGGTLFTRGIPGSESVFANAPANAQYACQSGSTAPGDTSGTPILNSVYYDSGDQQILGSGQVTSPAGTLQTTNGQTTYVPQTTSCASVLAFMTSPFSCMFRTFTSLIAATLIYISTYLLAIAGYLFNWLIDHTIIQFGTLYGTIKVAVETAWTAFRDIANIVIIGIFTFIAISIILGLKEYGQKKMIANVLIIAVFINFSLLFTKMIIDGSNYTAGQIYTAAALGGPGNGTPSATAPYGIADQFMNLLGVGTFGNAYKTVADAGEAADSNWAPLLHGLLVLAVVLGAAIVIFYGCFLMASRMIMLIFLMVTASIAFASYLIPKWSGSSYGWDAWWSSLLWCASFAPLLMFMLWMTLNVAGALKKGTTGTLGQTLSDPKASNIDALFAYVIVLGLLFTTFKLSSMWANKIGGFSMAKMIPGIGLGIGASLTGLVGRNTLGWGARFARQTMIDRGWTGRAGNEGLMGRARRQATITADRLSRTTYNPLKPKLVSTAASTFAVPKMFVGKDAIGAKDFEGKMKDKAKHADEVARRIQPPEAVRNQEAQDAVRREIEQRRQHRELMHQAVANTETLRNTFQQQARPQAEQRAQQNQPTRQDITQRVQAHQEAVTRAENEKSTAQTRQESEMREAHNAIERAALQARHEAELNTIDERARGHREDLTVAQRELTALNTAAGALAEQEVNATQQMQDFTRALDEGQAGLQEYDNETVRLANEARHEPERERAESLLWDSRAADDVRGVVRNHARDENLRSLRNILAEGQPQQQTPQQPPAG